MNDSFHPGWMLPEIVDVLALDLQLTESEPRFQLFRRSRLNVEMGRGARRCVGEWVGTIGGTLGRGVPRVLL